MAEGETEIKISGQPHCLQRGEMIQVIITSWIKRNGPQTAAAGVSFYGTTKTAAGINLDATNNQHYNWNDNALT